MKLTPFLVILGALLPTVAHCKVSLSDTQPVQLPASTQTSEVNRDDVSSVIPTDMQNSDDAGVVANRIGDRALQTWLNSPGIKNSSMGRTADKVNNSMKTEVALSPADPTGVEHKFSFQVLAFQAMSQIKYTGWLNAAINYNARANETVMEITEKIWNNKNFVISHIANTQQDLSAVGLRWDW